MVETQMTEEALTTAEVLGKFWVELEEQDFDYDFICGLVSTAARQIIADEGLIVGESEDDPDPEPEDNVVQLPNFKFDWPVPRYA